MTTDTTTTLVYRAEKALGISISIAPSGRAYYYAEEVEGAYWLSREDLAVAPAYAEEHGSDAYSHWCSATGRPMANRSLRALRGAP